MMPRPPSMGASVAGSAPATVCVGTWNMSHWTPAKAHIVAAEVGADILAVQETHLAAFPLECAHGTARRVGLHLHHGHPVPPVAEAVYGRSCGVGFLAREGAALQSVLPVGAAWRRLHAVGRLHAARVMPRPGLPQGVLLLTVYAPLQVRAQLVAREQFVGMMLEVVHGLDMQTPTLLMGDFNGSADPARDFLSSSGARRAVCPLLRQLLGPGSPWVDVHRALLDEVPWTFQNVDGSGRLSASRIDLVLANHAGMALVRGASVLQSVRDGGHSPVLVQLQLDTPLVLDWKRPQPRLPELLCQSSAELRQSAAWHTLLDSWLAESAVRAALHSTHSTGSELSAALVAALQRLVALAGGWVFRPRVRRAAYDSRELRQARRQLVDLNDAARLLRQVLHGAPAQWPQSLVHLIGRLASAGIQLPKTSAAELVPLVERAAAEQRAVIHRVSKDLRRLRHDRWARSVAVLWQDRPGVVYNSCRPVGRPGGQCRCWTPTACSVLQLLRWTLQSGVTGWTRSCGAMLVLMRRYGGLPSWHHPSLPTYLSWSGQLRPGLARGCSWYCGGCVKRQRLGHWASRWQSGKLCRRPGMMLWPNC